MAIDDGKGRKIKGGMLLGVGAEVVGAFGTAGFAVAVPLGVAGLGIPNDPNPLNAAPPNAEG